MQALRVENLRFPIGPMAGLFAVVLWAAAPLLIDFATTIPPLRLTAISLLTGSLAVLPLSLGRNLNARIPPGFSLVIYGVIPLLVLGAVGSYLVGLGMAPTAEAALITYTWPVMFVLISQWFTHGRLSGPVVGGAAIAFGGAVLLLAPDALKNGLSGNMAGYAFALTAGCCWALYSWLCQITPVTLTPFMPSIFLIAAMLAVAMGVALEPEAVVVSYSGIAAGAALGLGPYGLAMVAWDVAIRNGPTGLVGSLAYGVPVLAAFFLVVAGVATPSWQLPVAALLVVIGSVVARRAS
ncbi:MAG: DMT family transporter [Pseudomonadota bacterium]